VIIASGTLLLVLTRLSTRFFELFGERIVHYSLFLLRGIRSGALTDTDDSPNKPISQSHFYPEFLTFPGPLCYDNAIIMEALATLVPINRSNIVDSYVRPGRSYIYACVYVCVCVCVCVCVHS
jgi:hypothetical protein